MPDRLNKSGSPLSSSEGEILIEIIDDYGPEQLVHFPTRERNTLDLIITSLPGQFVDIERRVLTSSSPDSGAELKLVLTLLDSVTHWRIPRSRTLMMSPTAGISQARAARRL